MIFSNLKQNLCCFSHLIWDPLQASLCGSRNKKTPTFLLCYGHGLFEWSLILVYCALKNRLFRMARSYLQVSFVIPWLRKDKKYMTIRVRIIILQQKCRILALYANLIVSIRHVLVSPWKFKMGNFLLDYIWYLTLAVNLAVQYTQSSEFCDSNSFGGEEENVYLYMLHPSLKNLPTRNRLLKMH